MALIKALVAEFIGTFAIVFVSMAAVTVAPAMGVAVPALGYGLILIGMLFAFGSISGGHFNPAVTLAMLVGGQEKNIVKVVGYIVVQLVAGLVAALILVWAIPETVQIIPEGSTEWNFGLATGAMTKAGGGMWFAALLEGILTFVLVTVIYQAAVYGRAGSNAPLAIGFTLAACVIGFGVYTGGSLNPARTLGPALAAGVSDHLIPYLAASFSGGIIAGLVNGYLLNDKAK